LHKTAQFVAQELSGVFPDTYKDLLKLKGVGEYTAAAIASFSYNEAVPVVDGNVFRVLARFYGIHTPTDTKEGLMQFNTLAQQNLSKKEPGIYNQALMDFGATVCKPMAPICASCVFQTKCMAFNQNLVNQLPVKLKVVQKKKRYFDFFIFTHKDQVLIQKRQEQDIWRDLYQFYLVENKRVVVANDFYFKEVLVDQLSITAKNTSIVAGSAAFQQQLTHHLLQARFFTVHLTSIPRVFSKALWVKRSAIKKYPFPKIIHQYLEVHGVGVK
jgi:A/G-specific adenine glycosylase